ncbi:MAG TPA: RsmE family RNA methyltransferase [Phycisphaerae bacterium]|nr:RsmE family RNA methyltransferase [Phycisphaerae bacterium]
MHRFFAENLDGSEVVLPDGEAHHALHVLRLERGAEVELFDGQGAVAAGRVARVGRSEVAVTIEHLLPVQARPAPAVHLAFAVPKGKRLDWLLEKATELAAASLQPVVFERSVAGGDELRKGKLDRWRTHCVAAAKQCGLNFLPEIFPPEGLANVLRDRSDLPGLFGDCAPDSPDAYETLQSFRAGGHRQAVVLVGPEGGLTDAERDACLTAGLKPIRLGTTTLRIETAAVALLAAATAIL